MWGRTTLVSVAGLVAALLACKSQKDDSSSGDEAETVEASAEPAAETPKAPEPPADLEPAKVPEFAGCDLAAAAKALEGVWYDQVGGRRVTWQVTGQNVTWFDSAEHQSVLRVISPCSFAADEGSFSGAFVASGGKLYVAHGLVARRCGDRVVGCGADGRVYVLADGACTALTSSKADGAAPGVRRWTREAATCSLEKGETESFVATDKGGKTLRAGKAGDVYRDVRWEASKADSLETGKQLVALGDEHAKADESGPSRVKVTEGFEKLCDETKNAHACNNGAWYRCVNLKQCHLAVPRARVAVEQEPTQPGFLDTLAVVLCRTGKTDEANTYFKRSCDAGYTENCDKTCTPEEAKSTAVTAKAVAPGATASAAATGKDTGKRPKRPKRPSRPSR